MTILHYFFLLTSFFNHLQAKTQNNPLTLNLLHRYSQNSPFHNSSMTSFDLFQRLAKTSASRHRHFKQRLLTNFDTNIIPNDGDYLLNISIGVPRVPLLVVADTGSDLIWVQCQPCYRCYSLHTFDPETSRTFATLPCNSTFCVDSPNMECDDDTDQECEYFYAYGDGSTVTSGIMGTDLFSFGSNVSSSCVFGCGYMEVGYGFDPNADGLVGLGGGPLSLISQLGPTIGYKFSYCLTHTISNSTSKLRLGSHSSNAINRSSELSVITPMVNLGSSTYYAVNLMSIRFNGKEVETSRGIIIDSGSTLTYLGSNSYSSLEEMVREAVSGEPMANPPQQLSLCYEKSRFYHAPFNVSLQFDGGSIKLEEENIFLDFGDYVCLAIVPPDDQDDPMILGNVAQVNFEVEFDLRGRTVAFTPNNCSQDN